MTRHSVDDESDVIPQSTLTPVPHEATLPIPPLAIRRSRTGRVLKAASRFDDSPHSSLIAFASTFFPNHDNNLHYVLQPDLAAQTEPHPLVLVSEHLFGLLSADPDTMHLHEALQQADRNDFIKAMKKELQDHITRKHWMVIPLKNVPKHKKAIPMVWSMKRKRNPLGEIIKWKARLCAGGHRSIEFVDYWSTYSPVVSWQTIRLVLILALIKNWHIRAVDFVMTCPQADIKTDIYMKPPTVPNNFIIPDLPQLSDRFTHVYELIKNLYGLKDAGKTWNDFLKKGIIQRGWIQSNIDGCLFTKNGMLLILYVDDAYFISPYKHNISIST